MGGFRWFKAKLMSFLRKDVNLEQAPGSDLSTVKMVKTKSTMAALGQPSSDLYVSSTARSDSEGMLIGAPVVDTKFESNARVSKNIGLVAYIIGKLTLARKAVSVFVTNLIAAASATPVVKRIVKSKMDTTLVPVDAAEANSSETVRSGCTAAPIAANPEFVATNRSAVLDCAINVSATDAEEIAANRSVKTDSEATLVWWIFPEVDENGVLTIKQTYNATQTDDVLEVI